ncbi:hypothetical protein EDC18_101328 [Natranaerovirga pectinivora]|uniref:DUF4845 domain-containing protein n=1 Tax=Natranaerovirga pectinivora TaxID=682400 RepID=A0A4R3MQ83_9FIRM|nr:hypothetical protein [Natranaerovirga pectinivora]TCT17032.1 hypothetical protein EDC18_101328 [Natranaerovirga pectinivora]
MEISKIITISFSIVLLLCITVFIVELLVPISLKKDFNVVCNTYKEVAKRNGGITVEEKDALLIALEKLNLQSIDISNITLVSTKGYEEDIIFEVSATYSRSLLTSIFERDERELVFFYSRTFSNRRLVN